MRFTGYFVFRDTQLIVLEFTNSKTVTWVHFTTVQRPVSPMRHDISPLPNWAMTAHCTLELADNCLARPLCVFSHPVALSPTLDVVRTCLNHNAARPSTCSRCSFASQHPKAQREDQMNRECNVTTPVKKREVRISSACAASNTNETVPSPPQPPPHPPWPNMLHMCLPLQRVSHRSHGAGTATNGSDPYETIKSGLILATQVPGASPQPPVQGNWGRLSWPVRVTCVWPYFAEAMVRRWAQVIGGLPSNYWRRSRQSGPAPMALGFQTGVSTPCVAFLWQNFRRGYLVVMVVTRSQVILMLSLAGNRYNLEQFNFAYNTADWPKLVDWYKWPVRTKMWLNFLSLAHLGTQLRNCSGSGQRKPKASSGSLYWLSCSARLLHRRSWEQKKMKVTLNQRISAQFFATVCALSITAMSWMQHAFWRHGFDPESFGARQLGFHSEQTALVCLRETDCSSVDNRELCDAWNLYCRL